MTDPSNRVITITNNDIETEPGLGMTALEQQLRRENARLRRERNEALEQVERSSVPPPTRKQAAVAMTGKVVQWTGVALMVLTAAAQVASMYRPDLEAPIRTIIKLVQGLG